MQNSLGSEQDSHTMLPRFANLCRIGLSVLQKRYRDRIQELSCGKATLDMESSSGLIEQDQTIIFVLNLVLEECEWVRVDK